MCLILASAGPGAAHPRLPAEFVGINAPDTYLGDHVYRAQALRQQAYAGITIAREVFDWASIEVRPGVYDFTRYDDYVIDLAARGFDVLPIIFDAPRFRTLKKSSSAGVLGMYYPPTDPRSIRGFARALSTRYGRHGTLWRAHPEIAPRPIRVWQIWNEPDLPPFWGGSPNAKQYARLLLEARSGLRQGDRSAQVLPAALAFANVGPSLGDFISQLMHSGLRHHIDALAINAYAEHPGGILAEVQYARSILTRLGQPRLPIWVTEFGWASSGPSSPFTVTPTSQARLIAATIQTLIRHRCALHLRGIVYYSWRDAGPQPPNIDSWQFHTGLLNGFGVPKPSLRAFSRAIAGAPPTGC